MVTLRPIPGHGLRLPARAGTLLLVAGLLWGACASLTPLAWTRLAGSILVPASLIAALIKLKPRGKTPLAWADMLTRQAQRPSLLIAPRPLLDASHPRYRGAFMRGPF